MYVQLALFVKISSPEIKNGTFCHMVSVSLKAMACRKSNVASPIVEVLYIPLQVPTFSWQVL